MKLQTILCCVLSLIQVCYCATATGDELETTTNDLKQYVVRIRQAMGEQRTVAMSQKYAGMEVSWRFQWDPPYRAWGLQNADGSEQLTLVNERYAFGVNRKKNGEWRLTLLIGAHETGFEKMVANVDLEGPLPGLIFDLSGVGCLIDHPEWIQRQRIARGKDGNMLELTFRDDIGQLVGGQFLAGAVLQVHLGSSTETPVFPISRIVRVRSDETEEIVYADRQEVQGVLVPSQLEIRRIRGSESTKQVVLFDFSKIDERLERRKCYLSFYGISEPEWLQKPWWPQALIGVILTAIIVLSMLAVRTRRR